MKWIVRRMSLALLVALLGVHGAQAQKPQRSFGAWTVMLSPNGNVLTTMTANDSLQGLGLYCFIDSQRCVWFITLKLGCDKSNQYQVFANSDLSGPAALTLICAGAMEIAAFPGYYQYAFSDSDAVNNLLRSSRHVAFAIALADARFLSARFNLDGAHEAIANAQTYLKRQDSLRKPYSTPSIREPSDTRDRLM